jgi:glutamate:GABA antiporter
MGFRDLLLFYLVTGFTVRWIGTAAAAGPSAVVIWLMACLAFYVPLMFTVLELSSRYPNEGGCYVWSKRAFGDFAGFITGWTYWTWDWPPGSTCAGLQSGSGSTIWARWGCGCRALSSWVWDSLPGFDSVRPLRSPRRA